MIHHRRGSNPANKFYSILHHRRIILIWPKYGLLLYSWWKYSLNYEVCEVRFSQNWFSKIRLSLCMLRSPCGGSESVHLTCTTQMIYIKKFIIFIWSSFAGTFPFFFSVQMTTEPVNYRPRWSTPARCSIPRHFHTHATTMWLFLSNGQIAWPKPMHFEQSMV